jgi:SAM-dependent methyltransferase
MSDAADFTRWRYPFNVPGIPAQTNKQRLGRHEARYRYLFPPLLQFFGGTLEHCRVLDVGCHQGYWSLCAIRDGAEYVLGIDGREEHVAQARYVFEKARVDPSRYDFRTENVFDLDEEGFDVVFCLGLLYHVPRPYELIERLSAANTSVLLIDTAVCRVPGPVFWVRWDDPTRPLDSVDSTLVMKPSRQAVRALAEAFGYRVQDLPPSFPHLKSVRDYRRRKRQAFMCVKTPVQVPVLA